MAGHLGKAGARGAEGIPDTAQKVRRTDQSVSCAVGATSRGHVLRNSSRECDEEQPRRTDRGPSGHLADHGEPRRDEAHGHGQYRGRAQKEC